MNDKLRLSLLAVAAAALILPIAGAAGESNAANKASAAGSTVVFLGDEATGGSTSLSQIVLSSSIKTSPTQDLIFQVTMECALWTTVTTVGDDVQSSTARVSVTVYFDGAEVPVAGGDPDGTVVFCDRTHQQATSLFDDQNATIAAYLATRSANAFNWVLADVGGGTHAVRVVAELTGEASDRAVTQAAVGHRTLVIEPTHFAQGFAL